MKRNLKIGILILSALLLGTLWSCKSNQEYTPENQEYGFLQIQLGKGLTRGIVSGDPLEYLSQAKKLKVTLVRDNRTISQTLNLMAPADYKESAEFGLKTEKLELLAGTYRLTGYQVYGDAGELLQVADVDQMEVVIEVGRLNLLPVNVAAILRGRLSIVLDKDRDALIPAVPKNLVPASSLSAKGMKAAKANVSPAADRMYNYEDIKAVSLVLRNKVSGAEVQHSSIKVEMNEEGFLAADTLLSTIAGQYALIEYVILDKNNEVLLVDRGFKQEIIINIEDNLKVEARVPVKLQYNEAIKDYIALRELWRALDGENWYCRGWGMPLGVNWDFTRPVEEWGFQQGVYAFENGRVAAINLGAFNPKGDIPECLGQFTELNMLWIGEHSDVMGLGEYAEGDNHTSYQRFVNGLSLQETRWDVATDRSRRLNHPIHSALLQSLGEQNVSNGAYTKYLRKPTTYEVTPTGEVTNRITSLPDVFDKFPKLEGLFIANNYVKKMPPSVAKLKSLTDLEVFNCQKLEEFPVEFKDVATLKSCNFGALRSLSTEVVERGLAEFFQGDCNKEMELLYMRECNMRKLPEEVKYMTRLGLLDVSENLLEGEMTPLTKSIAIIQLYLDDNKLTSIGRDAEGYFSRIEDCESMSFVGNLLTEVPDIFKPGGKFLDVMGSVNLSNNKITKFENDFHGVQVETFNLNLNKFSGIFPDNLSTSESFVYNLLVSDNDIDSLPGSAFENLHMLSAFEALGNRLKYMPFEFNGRSMPYLQGLDLSNNFFARFPFIVLDPSNLTSFYFSSQMDPVDGSRSMKSWPEGIYKHKGIRVLQFQGNDFRQVDHFPEMLNYFDISDNPNVKMDVPPEIVRRLSMNLFRLVYDEDQNITFVGK